MVPSPDHGTMPMLRAGVFYGSPSRFRVPFLATPLQRSMQRSTIPMVETVAKKRYQAVGFPCNRMLKLSSSRGIRIDAPVLSVSWSFEDHSVNIKL